MTLIEVRWRPLTTEPLSDNDCPVAIGWPGRGSGLAMNVAQARVLVKDLHRVLAEHDSEPHLLPYAYCDDCYVCDKHSLEQQGFVP
jgi:hypothetical protein